MFQVNEDNSIYVTRGDMVFLKIVSTKNGEPYVFQAGDVLRIKIYGKKNCENVVLQKDFPVTEATLEVDIVLEKEDTKFGGIINKPMDYWYEIELNPFDFPQTIIGYDEDGPVLFKLFPEGRDIDGDDLTPEDIPFVDKDFDMTSTRPVQNQVIARAFANLESKVDEIKDVFITPQMYGAVGDGDTNDANSLQSAFNSGRSVRIPKGVYKVSGDIVINANNVNIIGEGATLLMNGHSLIVGGGSAKDLRSNFSLSGVELSAGSLKIKCLNNFSVDNCNIHNATYGLVGSHCYNGNITNSKFTDCEYGVLFDKDILAPNETADHNVITVRNCKFYNNTNTAFVIRGGYVGEFSYNAVEGNNKGMAVEGMADFTIMSNYFEYNTSDIITLKNYGNVLNSSIRIGGNRIFGKADSSATGMVLSGTIMGLFLQPNSWGGLNKLISNGAVLSGPVLLYQVNNTGKAFPDFVNNMCPINQALIINSLSAKPNAIAGRMYTHENAIHAQTNIAGNVIDYKLGYVPTLYATPNATAEGLIYKREGNLYVVLNGQECQIQIHE